MAETIAEGVNEIEGIDVKIQRANETTIDNLLAADGIIVGSPTYYGIMSASVKELFDKYNKPIDFSKYDKFFKKSED